MKTKLPAAEPLDISAELRAERARRDLGQTDVANLLDLNVRTIQNFEARPITAHISVAHLVKIAGFLRRPIAEVAEALVAAMPAKVTS